MASTNGHRDLDDEQQRVLRAAVNAQKALTATETERLPTLRQRRDAAFARALEMGIPASTLADQVGLSAGRLSQMRSKFRDAGILP